MTRAAFGRWLSELVVEIGRWGVLSGGVGKTRRVNLETFQGPKGEDKKNFALPILRPREADSQDRRAAWDVVVRKDLAVPRTAHQGRNWDS